MTSTMQDAPGIARTPTPHDLDRTLSRYSCLRWSPLVDNRGQVVVATGDVFDAVSVPVGLVRAVQRELAVAMLPAPIVAEPALGRATILSAVATKTRMTMSDDLIEARVRALPRRTPVLLPVLVIAGWDGSRFWVSPPDATLPPWTAVVGAARRALNRVSR